MTSQGPIDLSKISIDDPKTPQRWQDELPPLSAEAQKLLVEYSGIPPEEVVDHVNKIRKDAFAIHPYPCIGMSRFLNLSLPNLPTYTSILSTLLSHPSTIFLDLGCCFGVELRHLFASGVSPSQLYGAELQPSFVDLGYQLFRDKDSDFGKSATFLTPCNVFEPGPLEGLEGKVDVLHAGSFFHLFGYEEQVRVARRVVRLLKPGKGSVLVGRQVGNVHAGEYARAGVGGSTGFMRFRHNVESWRKMWEVVGRETGSKWHVQAELRGVAPGWTSWDGEGDGKKVAEEKNVEIHATEREVRVGAGTDESVGDEIKGRRRLFFTVTREE